MPRVFQSHHDEEPQRLTTAAARSTEESARLRADLAAATGDLAFEMDSARSDVSAVSVSANSILASSTHSSGDDGVPSSSLTMEPLIRVRTGTFLEAANTVLDRTSLASSQSSDGYGSAPSGQFNDSLIRSPEFDKMSLDATPVTHQAAIAAAADADDDDARDSEIAPPRAAVASVLPPPPAPVLAINDSFQSHRPTDTRMTIMEMSAGPASSEVEFRGTEKRRHTANLAPPPQHPPPQQQLQARFTTGPMAPDASGSSSGMSRELNQNAFGATMSDSAYMNMRKTLDPEALLNGDPTNPANMAVLSSLRPITDPFDLMRDPNLPGPDFQRGRAATAGAVMLHSGRQTVGRPTIPRTSSRAQRSYTVAGQMPVPAPAILAHDPRGTFRTTTADTAQQIFASQQVRLQNKWSTDVWIYMKNAHPFLGICTAHRWHPYKKKDRALVLLTTILLAIFLCGLYATQQCCQTAAESAIAVIAKANKQQHRRLDDNTSAHRALGETVNCRPFGASCDASENLCSLGSSCVQGKCVALDLTAATTQCAASGAVAQCPPGWSCAPSRGVCRPSTSLVCYLPTPSADVSHTSRGVSFAADDGTGSGSNSGAAPLDAISAIAALLKYGKDNNLTDTGPNVVVPAATPAPSPTTVQPSATPIPTQTQTPTPTPTPTPVAKTTTPTPTIVAPTNRNSTTNGGKLGDEGVMDPTAMNATVETLLITLTQPLDQGVYTVASEIPIAWEVRVLQGERSFVNTLRFRVDFSKDGKDFTMIASDIASDSVLDVTPIKYHFDWDLALDDSLACSTCVLRVCTQQDATTVSDPFCIRTDGATALTSTATTTANGTLTAASAKAASAAPRITFHIVRDIVECACGIKYASFVTYSYLLALVVPMALLLLEQLVTFYQDSKVLGMFARKGGPKMPVIGFYASEATKRGRIVLGFMCVCLVFACGMVAARINKDNFLESKGDVVVLWVLMVALVVVVGFIYCSAIYCIVFTVRWYQDEKTWNEQGFADFAMMFDDSRNNQTMLQNQNQQQQHGFAQQDPATAGSYQWPFAGDMTGSIHSNYSQAVVTQRSGQAIV